MLVLSRDVNQSLVFLVDGVEIARIVIGRIKGETVKLLIDAPAEVQILRSELNKSQEVRS
jgi:carbon storage regulator CsrA